MRTIGLLIIASIVAGCAASPEHRAVAPAPPQEIAVAPKAVQPAPERPVVQMPPRQPATGPAVTSVMTPATVPVATAAPTAPPPKPKPAVPPDYRQYLLQTRGNWWLRIDRDGGGAYGYSGSPEDRATFGAGTFEFGKLGQTLKQKMAVESTSPNATAVTLSPRKGVPTQGVIADGRFVRSLFDEAKSHRQGDLVQLDHVESSFPIVPVQSGQD